MANKPKSHFRMQPIDENKAAENYTSQRLYYEYNAEKKNHLATLYETLRWLRTGSNLTLMEHKDKT